MSNMEKVEAEKNHLSVSEITRIRFLVQLIIRGVKMGEEKK